MFWGLVASSATICTNCVRAFWYCSNTADGTHGGAGGPVPPRLPPPARRGAARPGAHLATPASDSWRRQLAARGPSAPGLRDRRGGDRGDDSASDGSRFSLCTRVSRATDRNRNATVSRQRPVPGVTSRPRPRASGEGGGSRGIATRSGPGARRGRRAPSVPPGVQASAGSRGPLQTEPAPATSPVGAVGSGRRGGAPPHPRGDPVQRDEGSRRRPWSRLGLDGQETPPAAHGEIWELRSASAPPDGFPL